MPRRRLLALLLALGALALAACGGGSGDDKAGARERLAGVKPLESARANAVLRLALDGAPAEVGDEIRLSFSGPLRSNGVDKLPSLDWKIAFSGFATTFESRLVSTGDDVFVALGGEDFQVGREAVARAVGQARKTQQRPGQGLAALGIDPLGAVRSVEESGTGEVAGTKTTRYTGTVDPDALFVQYEKLAENTPGAAGAAGLTPEQRAQVKRTFAPPTFEAHVAEDDTIRRLVVATRFATTPENREASGGISGGRIEYRLEYSDVGGDFEIVPPTDARPIGEFAAELTELIAGGGTEAP